jgi:hypothetical protein
VTAETPIGIRPVRSIERVNLALAGAAVAAAIAFVSPWFALSLALGVALEATSFRALSSAARRLFTGELAGSGPWLGVFAARFALLAFALWASLGAGAHPVGLVVGLSLIVPAALLGAWLDRPPILEPGPAPPPDDPLWDRWDPWLAREREAPRDDAASGEPA